MLPVREATVNTLLHYTLARFLQCIIYSDLYMNFYRSSMSFQVKVIYAKIIWRPLIFGLGFRIRISKGFLKSFEMWVSKRQHYNTGIQICQPLYEDRNRFLFLCGRPATVGLGGWWVSILAAKPRRRSLRLVSSIPRRGHLRAILWQSLAA